MNTKIKGKEVLVKIWDMEIDGIPVTFTRQTTIRNQAPDRRKYYVAGFKKPVDKSRLLECL